MIKVYQAILSDVCDTLRHRPDDYIREFRNDNYRFQASLPDRLSILDHRRITLKVLAGKVAAYYKDMPYAPSTAHHIALDSIG